MKVLIPNVAVIVAVFTPTDGELTVSIGGAVYPIPGVILNNADIPKVYTTAVAVLIPTLGAENVSIGKLPDV